MEHTNTAPVTADLNTLRATIAECQEKLKSFDTETQVKIEEMKAKRAEMRKKLVEKEDKARAGFSDACKSLGIELASPRTREVLDDSVKAQHDALVLNAIAGVTAPEGAKFSDVAVGCGLPESHLRPALYRLREAGKVRTNGKEKVAMRYFAAPDVAAPSA